jgi:hypothetical protein
MMPVALSGPGRDNHQELMVLAQLFGVLTTMAWCQALCS